MDGVEKLLQAQQEEELWRNIAQILDDEEEFNKFRKECNNLNIISPDVGRYGADGNVEELKQLGLSERSCYRLIDSFKRSGVKRKLIDVSEAQSGHKKSKYEATPVETPTWNSGRHRFGQHDDEFYIIPREAPLKKLNKFLAENRGAPAVYIQGPEGIGKSHLLLYCVTLLRARSDTRVIFIADCGAWVAQSKRDPKKAWKLFLDDVTEAFYSDQQVLDAFPEELNISACLSFLEFLAAYCIEKHLNLYAIFDQHNGLPKELWSTFPFSIPHSYLPTQKDWAMAKAVVVLSAATSNDYFLRTAFVNQWPTLHINEGFSEAEALEFLDHHNFFDCFENKEEQVRKEIYQRLFVEGTSNIPSELMKITACSKSLKDKFADIDCDAEKLNTILALYSDQRIQEYSVMMKNFEKEFATTENTRRCVLEGLVLMELGISPGERRACYLLNDQLMIDDNISIKPITPLARQVLLSFWQQPFWDHFEKTIKLILRNEEGHHINDDALSRVAKRYFVSCVEQAKALKLELKKIQADTTPDKWETHSFQSQDLIYCRFYGTQPPTRHLDFLTKSYAFLPTVSNHSNIELLVWDHPTQTYYAIQITVKEHLHIGLVGIHKDLYLWEAKAKQWGASSVDTKFVWASPYPATPGHNGDYWTDFASLDEGLFPVYHQLPRQQSL